MSYTLEIVIGVIFLTLFIMWQIKVGTKYLFKFDNVQLDELSKIIHINQRKIYYKEIDYIEVIEGEQPSVAERCFSRGASYNYMTIMILHLKDGSVVECNFNYKGAIYKILKKMQPYVKIISDIEKYKPENARALILIIFLAVFIILMLTVLSH